MQHHSKCRRPLVSFGMSFFENQTKTLCTTEMLKLKAENEITRFQFLLFSYQLFRTVSVWPPCVPFDIPRPNGVTAINATI